MRKNLTLSRFDLRYRFPSSTTTRSPFPQGKAYGYRSSLYGERLYCRKNKSAICLLTQTRYIFATLKCDITDIRLRYDINPNAPQGISRGTHIAHRRCISQILLGFISRHLALRGASLGPKKSPPNGYAPERRVFYISYFITSLERST